mgnify:CR=1 FL=1
MALLVAAAFLDGIDGRVARLMGATSRIGAEIDSLADAINFGVVPAMIVYFHFIDGHDLGWVLALIYCCAIVLRLARFNTLLDDDGRPVAHVDLAALQGVDGALLTHDVPLDLGAERLVGLAAHRATATA